MDENEIKMDEDVMDETDIDEIGEDEDEDFDNVEEDDVDSSNSVAGAFAGLGGVIYYAYKKRVVERAVAAVKAGVNTAKETFKKSATDVDVIDTVKVKNECIPINNSNKKSTEK